MVASLYLAALVAVFKTILLLPQQLIGGSGQSTWSTTLMVVAMRVSLLQEILSRARSYSILELGLARMSGRSMTQIRSLVLLQYLETYLRATSPFRLPSMAGGMVSQ
jgi:hypothetical protein